MDGLQGSVQIFSGSPVTSSVGTPSARGRERGFDAGMTAADDDRAGVAHPRVASSFLGPARASAGGTRKPIMMMPKTIAYAAMI